ncbi:MAG: DUF2062 domain-containing protein [Nitrospirota bacterium]
MVSLQQIRSHLKQLLHLDEPPRKTALAFAIGVFIAFSPTYGLHTLSAAFCAWAFRLNAIALFAGAFINNPWTAVPILAATFWTGFQLLGLPETAPFNWSDLSPASLYQQVAPYALPFFIGGLALSLLGALVSYPAAYLLITQYRARLRQAAPRPDRLPPQGS